MRILAVACCVLVATLLAFASLHATVFHVSTAGQDRPDWFPYTSENQPARTIREAIRALTDPFSPGEAGDTVYVHGIVGDTAVYYFCPGDTIPPGTPPNQWVVEPDPSERLLRIAKRCLPSFSGCPQGDTCEPKPIYINYPLVLLGDTANPVVFDGLSATEIAINDSATYLAKVPGAHRFYDKYPLVTVHIDSVYQDGDVENDAQYKPYDPPGESLWVDIRNIEMRYAGNFLSVPLTNSTEIPPDVSTSLGGAITCWTTGTRIINNYIHDISGGSYFARGGAVFVLGDTVKIEGNRFEDNMGGYYGGAIFTSSGFLGGDTYCGSASHDPELPCKRTLVEIRNNIFRNNIANFGGAVLAAADLPYVDVDTLTPPNRVIIENNLFAANRVREFENDGHPHSGASAIYLSTTRYKVQRNTIVKNNWDHRFVVRNNGALAVSGGRDSVYSTIRENIIANNKGGGFAAKCQAWYQNPYAATAIPFNFFWNNVTCSGLAYNYARGSIRAADTLSCSNQNLNCFFDCDVPCCSNPIPGANPCTGDTLCNNDHPPAYCRSTWHAIPDSGNTNRYVDPQFCTNDTSVVNGLFELHCNSLAHLSNNPWGRPIGWTQQINCGNCGGGTCPFVSVWDGNRYWLDNNVLPQTELASGSPPYVTDLYPLIEKPYSEDGLLRLRLSEFETELGYFDEVKLFAVDLPTGVGIATTRNGAIVFYEELAAPDLVTDPMGQDITDSLALADSVAVSLGQGAEVSVTFSVAAFGKEASHSGGSISLPKQKQQEGAKAASLKGERGVWNPESGKSQADFYDLVGGIEMAVTDSAGVESVVDTLFPRAAWCAQYTDLDDYFHEAGDSARIRLRWLGDHRLDRMILGSPVAPPAMEELPLVSATHSVAGDVADLLDSADSSYAMLDVGEVIDLVFGDLVAPPTGERRYLIQTKGYYLLFAGKREGAAGNASAGLPRAFTLRAASPNPGSAWTRFRYELPRPTRVIIRIYDITGRVVATLLDASRPAGYHGEIWDGKRSGGERASAGVYFARLEAGAEHQTIKFVLIR